MSPGIRDKTDAERTRIMDKMEGLRAGVAEMRSVARRLLIWADDLETSFQNRQAEQAEMGITEPVHAEKRKKAETEDTGNGKPAGETKKNPALTLSEVRAILAEKCAKGFSTQVKALIESYGVTSLKNVPAEKYEELLEAVQGLGDADAG